MNCFQSDEPNSDFFEEVEVGRRFHLCPNVKLTFNSRTGDFDVLFGRIDHRTPWQINRRRPTILTLSGGGHTFVVTRRPGGGL